MINQLEPVPENRNLMDTINPLIQTILLGAILILFVFKSSSVTVNPSNATVNVEVNPENTFSPNNIFNISMSPIINISGFNSSCWNYTFPFNYTGNYTINNTYINNTYLNFTTVNITNINTSAYLHNESFNTVLCDVYGNGTFKTWCWV